MAQDDLAVGIGGHVLQVFLRTCQESFKPIVVAGRVVVEQDQSFDAGAEGDVNANE